MGIDKYVSKAAKAGEVYYLQHLHDSWADMDKKRLMANELLYPPSQKMIDAAISVTGLMHLYPEDASTDVELRGKLAEYVGLPGRPDYITVGNGSMEIIDMIYKTFINEGDEILVSTPDYSPYARRAKMFLAHVTDILPEDDIFNYSAEDFTSKITPKTKMIIISRPNNPDGHFISREIVETLCKEDLIVVIDEAYYEFAEDPVEDLLDKYQNLVISHTFSKAMGLAGIRLGFVVANPDVIEFINRVRMPSNINLFARAVAMAALDDVEYIRENTERVKADRQYLYDEVEKIKGLRPIPSESNFVMIDCEESPKTAEEFYQYLLGRGFMVRKFIESRGLPGNRFFRITIGTHEDIVAVIDAMKEFVED